MKKRAAGNPKNKSAAKPSKKAAVVGKSVIQMGLPFLALNLVIVAALLYVVYSQLLVAPIESRENAYNNAVFKGYAEMAKSALDQVQNRVNILANLSSVKAIVELEGAERLQREKTVADELGITLGLRVLPLATNRIDKDSKPPINNIVLDLLRKSSITGGPLPELLKSGDGPAYLLFVAPVIVDETHRANLVVAYSTGLLSNAMKGKEVPGYLELVQQFGQSKTVGVSQGNKSLKQGNPNRFLRLPNSAWRIDYWFSNKEKLSFAEGNTQFMIYAGLILAITLICYAIAFFLLKKFIYSDSKKLTRALAGVIGHHFSVNASDYRFDFAYDIASTLSKASKGIAGQVVSRGAGELPSVSEQPAPRRRRAAVRSQDDEKGKSAAILKERPAAPAPKEAAPQSAQPSPKQTPKPAPKVTQKNDAKPAKPAQAKPASVVPPSEPEPAIEPALEMTASDNLDAPDLSQPLEFESMPKTKPSIEPESEVEESLDEAFAETFQETTQEDAPELSLDQPSLAPAEEINIDRSMFRAYDIRGIVDENLTEEAVHAIGRAIGSEAFDAEEQTVIVARDGRLSGPKLLSKLKQGILETGRDVIDLGEVPTPVLYYATHKLESATGVMLTGSHNPSNYNGLKIVIAGKTLSGPDIQGLYERLEAGNLMSGQGSEKSHYIVNDYIKEITSDIALAQPLKIVVDCGNGVCGQLAPKLFEALGCEVIPLYCEVDGRFPNHHPDPSKPENLEELIEKVKSEQADLGLAFDGDGDRLGVVASDGKIIWPDRQLMLFAIDVLSRNPGADVIYDVKCSRHLPQVISGHGGRPLMWKTGHSFIKGKMRDTGALLAGECSGHMFFKERWFGFDDGLYAGARLLEILGNDFRASSQVFETLPEGTSTPEINVALSDDEKFEYIDNLVAQAKFENGEVNTIDGVRVDFDNGWGLVRASNTTPNLVIRFEADDEQALEEIKAVFKEKMLSVNSALNLPF